MSIGSNELVEHQETCEECIKRVEKMDKLKEDSDEWFKLSEEIMECFWNNLPCEDDYAK